MAAALADHLGKIGLRIEELIAEPLVAGRFLERIEVGSLDVFDDRELERLPVVGLEADDRHLMQSGALRRPPAPLTGDNFVSVRDPCQRAREKRLNDAFFLDRGGQLVEAVFAEIPARVARIGAEKFDRNFLLAANARGRGERLRAAKQGGKTAPEPRRRCFGGFSWLHAEIPRLRIILLVPALELGLFQRPAYDNLRLRPEKARRAVSPIRAPAPGG